MEKKINWLHFSDLHYGQKSQNILFPKLKKELFKDIELIKNNIGKIDVVFFTGDLTQAGKKEEFDELTVFLKELWSHFNKLSCNPLLIAIPGNHDLNRPDTTKAVVKVLRGYNKDIEFQNSFWSSLHSKGEYYELINQCFDNFCNWYNEIALPKPVLKHGLIPGDISTEILINDVRLKVVGLNTAFLELTSEDYLGKLAINPEQIFALTSKDPFSWAENSDIALFLTHHDPSWYDKKSTEFYNNDINPTNTYFNHLCGHLHEANSFDYGLVGSQRRRIQLAPSLFGLQTINEQQNRIHGYFAGSYTLTETNIIESFYPRIVHKKYGGDYAIVADNGFELDNKIYCETQYTIKIKHIISFEIENTTTLDQIKIEQSDEESLISENILDLNFENKSLKELEKIPKISYGPLTQHIGIRIVEQNKFIEIIKKGRFSWLITDWGLNEGGFIGSISENLNLENPKNNFILNCEDIINEEELLSAFNEQFAMPLQSFCNIVSKLGNTLLILNHINTNLYSTSNSYNRFIDIIKSINDYCPNICIILIARQAPNQISNEEYVRLFPLDALQVQSYIENHPNTEDDLLKSENLLKLIEVTSGLPKHIDRVIENLKVTSFDEFIEAEKERPFDVLDNELIPKSLKQVIGTLADTTDKLKLRSFKLLKTLTILANGETMNNLIKFDSREPIYIDNANELEQLSLLEVISTNRVLSQVSGQAMQQIKLLRIPRQIRDYVNTIITDGERDDILKNACNLYFGNKWREGSIKNIQTSSLYGSSKFLNIDNCHLMLKKLLSNAFKAENDFEIERAALLSINYCEHVYNIDDYKNALSASEEIYTLLKSTNLTSLKSNITKLYGESLRMAGFRDKAIIYLNEALTFDEGLSNSDRNDIQVELGFSYIMELKYDKAIECAKAIEKLSSPKDIYRIQSKYILVQATFKGDELIRKLKGLESEARKVNSITLANTISLNIARLTADSNDKSKRLAKVLETKNDDYNKIRAIVQKTLDIVECGNGEISNEDLILLNLAYSYLYSQRLQSLFTNCHKVLWLYCLNNHKYQDLLNLFKHSSLVWRISGTKELEEEYFNKLEQIGGLDIDSIPKSGINSINIDYYKRRKLEFKSFNLLN